VIALDAVIAAMTFDQPTTALDSPEGQWSVVAFPCDTFTDEQCLVNGDVKVIDHDNGVQLPMVSVPAGIDGDQPDLRPAPSLGQHTEEIIAILGRNEEELLELRIPGIVY